VSDAASGLRAGPDADPDWDGRLRTVGLRSTAQRRAVLRALGELRHATVDELAAHVQRELPDVSLSTVYRTLEVLDEVGLVRHTHLHHGAPTYHSVDEEPHLHLVCAGCGSVEQAGLAVAVGMAAEVRAASGFQVDLGHLALHGRCAACARADQEGVQVLAPGAVAGADSGSSGGAAALTGS